MPLTKSEGLVHVWLVYCYVQHHIKIYLARECVLGLVFAWTVIVLALFARTLIVLAFFTRTLIVRASFARTLIVLTLFARTFPLVHYVYYYGFYSDPAVFLLFRVTKGAIGPNGGAAPQLHKLIFVPHCSSKFFSGELWLLEHGGHKCCGMCISDVKAEMCI